MSSIGTLTVDIVRGQPAATRPRVETWQVPGIDGYGAMLLGNGDSAFELTSVLYCDDDAAAQTHCNACTQAQGTIVTITDDWGDDYANVLIQRVDVPIKRPCIRKGHAHAVRVEIHWRCVADQ